MTVDVCKFFRNHRKFFIPNFLYTFLKPFTNVNHTCPYLAGTEMRLWQWTPDEDGVLAKLPVDHGQYGLQTTWYINKSSAMQINVLNGMMTRSQRIYLYLFWVNTLGYNHVIGSYKFNALICDVRAPELGFMKQCNIKAIDRKHNMINIEAVLNKTILEFSIRFIMVKRESGGWHPFMYDMTVDICKFFRNPRKFFIPNLIYSFIKPFTNVNHSCPYKAGSDMSLLHWTPDEDGVIAKFPVDHGQYGLHTTWYINKITALKINGSVLFFK